MDWFVKAFLKASLAWLGAGVTHGPRGRGASPADAPAPAVVVLRRAAVR
jgi:hypothetical protein